MDGLRWYAGEGAGLPWQTTSTGSAMLEIPLPLPACRQSTPSLSIVYRSDAGDGLFGHGWNVAVPTICRRTALGVPRYDDTDVFLGIDGQWLIPGDVRTTDRFGELALDATWHVRRYRPRVDNACDLVEYWSADGEFPFWVIRGADGSVAIYGKRHDARLADPDDPARIAEWRLQESVSRLGEHALYAYLAEDGANVIDNRDRRAARYLGTVKYGHPRGSATPYAWRPGVEEETAWYFETILDYGQRPTDESQVPGYATDRAWPRRADPRSDVRYGFEHRSLRLCRQVLMFHRFPSLGPEPVLVRRVLADYDEQPWLSRLTGIRTIAYGAAGDTEQAAPLDIAWSDFIPGVATTTAFAALPAVNDGYRGELVDLYGEGVPGILHRDDGTWTYREPRRARGSVDGIDYGPAVPLPCQPALHGNDAAVAAHKGRTTMTSPPAVSTRRLLVDITCEGRPSWVIVEPSLRGYFALDAMRRWSDFQPFDGLPLDFRHEYAQWADLTGAGRMDLVLIAATGVRWWRRMDTGYDKGEWVAHTGDRLPLPDTRHHLVTFANVRGTHSPQLVRVASSGLITCWASLGFGHFTPGVLAGSIDLAGERLDPARAFLVDIDGTGTDDLLYATSSALLLFRNHAGHGFARNPVPYAWPEGRRYERTWSLSFVDVTGVGSASAVITVPHGAEQAPRHWRMDFTAATPNLVTGINNNRGCATTVTYRSSAQAWLDEKTDSPDAPRLPYPAPLVASIVTHDEIAGRGTRAIFRWRQGFYDVAERRTRGFAFSERVEQVEGGPDPATPDTLRRTWRHVGDAAVDGDHGDFDASDPLATGIGPPMFSRWRDEHDELGADFDETARKELWRALTGNVRRMETFASHDGVAVGHARVTEEARYLVRQVHEGNGTAGVYLVSPVESLTYTYEDTPHDPRRGHGIALDLDVFGSPRRHLAFACARRRGNPPDDDAEEGRYWTDSLDDSQRYHHVTLTRSRPWHLDGVDAWLLRVPGETRTDAAFVDPTELADDDLGYKRFADQGLPDGVSTGLVSLIRAVYDDDPSRAPDLPALPRSLQVAGMDQDACDEWLGVIDTNTLEDWRSAGGWFAMVATSIEPGENLWAITRERRTLAGIDAFYLPQRVAACDSIAWTRLGYDEHELFVQLVTTPDGLATSYRYDYRHLMPWRTVDGNDNIHDMARDAFGRELAGSDHGTEKDEAGRQVAVGFESLDAWVPPVDRSPATAMDAPAATLGTLARAQRYAERAWMGSAPSNTPPATLKAWREAGWITADGFVRSRGRIAEPSLAALPRRPAHRVTLYADRYPGDPAAVVASTVTYYDGFGRSLGHARREPDDEGGMWSIVDRQTWHDDQRVLHAWKPHFTRGWRHEAWPDPSIHPATCFGYDAEGRLVSTVDPAGRETRASIHAWYRRVDDAKRTAEVDDGTGMGTPQLVATDAQGNAARQWHYYRRVSSDVPVLRLSRTQRDATGRNERHYDARSVERGEPVRTSSPALGVPRTWSADAGERWVLQGDSGATIGTIDPRGYRTTQRHDAAGRPTLRETVATGGSVTRVTERILYVAPDTERRVANIADLPQATYGDGGYIATQRVALTGAVQETIRRLPTGDDDIDWANLSDGERKLESSASIAHATHDAVGREIGFTDTAGHSRTWTFDIAGHLAAVSVTLADGTPIPLLMSVRYDADGHPLERIDANGVISTWRRDHRDGRILGHLAMHGNTRLRDLTFAYDPNANVTVIRDTAPLIGGDADTTRMYSYDSIDQLIEGRGRENNAAAHSAALPAPTLLPSSHKEALRDYVRRWYYDANGNVVRVEHDIPTQPGAAYALDMIVAPLSNRALPSEPGLMPGDVDARFDAAGNLMALPSSGHALQWDDRQRLREQTASASQYETYLYDSHDLRARKRSYQVVAGRTRIDERRYEPGIERVLAGDTSERHDEIAIDTGTGAIRIAHWSQGMHPNRIRYSLDSHPLSTAMTLDENGSPATYEEYHPFGGTALQAAVSTTEADDHVVRYSGKERDTDGLYDYGARFYAPWLWRWISADPAEDGDGTNRYRMTRNNPASLRDDDGKMPRRTIGAMQPPPSIRHGGNAGPARQNRYRPGRQLQRVPTGADRGLGPEPSRALELLRPLTAVETSRPVPLEQALGQFNRRRFTASPFSNQSYQGLLANAEGIGEFVVMDVTIHRPSFTPPQNAHPDDIAGYRETHMFVLNPVLASTTGPTGLFGQFMRGISGPVANYQFQAYYVPQGGSVTIPMHPQRTQPRYLVTPDFSGCSLVVHQHANDTYEVFHVTGGREDEEYNRRQPPVGGTGAAAIMSYPHYAFEDRPTFRGGASLVRQELGTQYRMGFAYMRYMERDLQNGVERGWILHYQQHAAYAAVSMPHMTGSQAMASDLSVRGTHWLRPSDPSQRVPTPTLLGAPSPSLRISSTPMSYWSRTSTDSRMSIESRRSSTHSQRSSPSAGMSSGRRPR